MYNLRIFMMFCISQVNVIQVINHLYSVSQEQRLIYLQRLSPCASRSSFVFLFCFSLAFSPFEFVQEKRANTSFVLDAHPIFVQDLFFSVVRGPKLFYSS